MALWGTHFAICGLGALMLITWRWGRIRFRWLAVGLSGLWAIVPDADWVYPPLRSVTKPVIHDTVVSNLYWFHGIIDGSVLDYFDSRARPWLSVPMLIMFLWVYAMVIDLETQG